MSNGKEFAFIDGAVFEPQQLRALLRNDIEAARALAAEGITRGIDPSTLLLTVAGMAQKAGKLAEAHEVLQNLLQRKPSSFDGQYRLGVLYLQERDFPHAVLALKEAVRLRPTSADAFFMLGQAEEAQYHYSDAQKAYAQALHFAADNSGYRQRYEAFLKKLQKNEGTTRAPITTSSTPSDRARLSPPKL